MDNDLLAKLIILPLSGLFFLTLFVGLFLVVRDTRRGAGRWGINTRPVSCPECGTPAPIVRTPKNRRQALWGGNTCTDCGTEYDKWGHYVNEDRHD